ncbi:hypothetical protein NLJ89_g8394 [Agrocybe chaxingu]|uniref:Uncharacterized protein n=1 Tax=Agrocybe chaxingu TaxID=84603 RepID=A0A9W8MU53_9AGAR|nr:hypothetical protein NLJ89_g8394 [Agrocybe chaxingu]
MPPIWNPPDAYPPSHHNSIQADSIIEASGIDNETTAALVLNQFSGYLALLESLPPAIPSEGPMSEVDILLKFADPPESVQEAYGNILLSVFVSSDFTIEAAQLVAAASHGSLSHSHISKERAAAHLHSACLHNLKMFDIVGRQLQRLTREMHQTLVLLETNLALLADSTYTETLADAEHRFWEAPSGLWGVYADFWILPRTRRNMDVLLRVSSSAKMMKSFVLGTEDAKLLSDGVMLEDFIFGLESGCAKLKGQIKPVKQDGM